MEQRTGDAATLVKGALSGVLAAAAGTSAATGLAALLGGVPSPIVSVGNGAVDLAPGTLKDFAVREFGTADKPILIGGVILTLAVLAAIAGIIGLRNPRLAYAITAALGLIALASAATDRTAEAPRIVVILPALVTIIVSLALLSAFLKAIRLAPHPSDDLVSAFDRRKFLKVVLGAGAIVVFGGAIGKLFDTGAARASREALRIPTPADAAAPVPAGVSPDVKGISKYLTPNRDFYRVDTALRVPDVPAEGWNLRIHGMVDTELNLSFRDLLRERLVERRITIACVSNEVGGPYIGNATWIGVPIRDLLERAGMKNGADAVLSTSADDFTVGTPLSDLTDGRDALLAIAMNGQPLPVEHGFPVRMVVPGLYGYVSATKWLVDMEVTRFADFTAYWTDRDWDPKAPIKTSSRIDVPRSSQSFARDKVRAGGVAWAQTKGIKRVEVRVDDGDWVEADLAAEDTADTWRQWSWQWDGATPGTHELTVRSTDASGYTQTSKRASPRPDGATGWHSVQFSVD